MRQVIKRAKMGEVIRKNGERELGTLSALSAYRVRNERRRQTQENSASFLNPPSFHFTPNHEMDTTASAKDSLPVDMSSYRLPGHDACYYLPDFITVGDLLFSVGTLAE